MFRRILAALLDEDEEAPYCMRKYNIYGAGNEEDEGDEGDDEDHLRVAHRQPAEESRRRRRQQLSLSRRHVYGGAAAPQREEQEEGVPEEEEDDQASQPDEDDGPPPPPPSLRLGGWILPQTPMLPGNGAVRQLAATTSARHAKSQSAPAATAMAATCRGVGGGTATCGEYCEELFLTEWANQQPVISTGAILNSYTGEIAETFEDAIPAPDRSGGGGQEERESRSKQLRLQWAQGGETTTSRRRSSKADVESILPAADAGRISELQSHQQRHSVSLEALQRGEHAMYGQGNGEVLDTPLMTRNPIGYHGHNNTLRFHPHLPATNELDLEGYMPVPEATATTWTNASMKPKTRLLREEPRLGQQHGGDARYGPAEPSSDTVANVKAAKLRRSNATRHLQESAFVSAPDATADGRSSSAAPLGSFATERTTRKSYGAAAGGAAAARGPTRGASDGYDAAATTASAESVLKTLGLGSAAATSSLLYGLGGGEQQHQNASVVVAEATNGRPRHPGGDALPPPQLLGGGGGGFGESSSGHNVHGDTREPRLKAAAHTTILHRHQGAGAGGAAALLAAEAHGTTAFSAASGPLAVTERELRLAAGETSPASGVLVSAVASSTSKEINNNSNRHAADAADGHHALAAARVEVSSVQESGGAAWAKKLDKEGSGAALRLLLPSNDSNDALFGPGTTTSHPTIHKESVLSRTLGSFAEQRGDGGAAATGAATFGLGEKRRSVVVDGSLASRTVVAAAGNGAMMPRTETHEECAKLVVLLGGELRVASSLSVDHFAAPLASVATAAHRRSGGASSLTTSTRVVGPEASEDAPPPGTAAERQLRPEEAQLTRLPTQSFQEEEGGGSAPCPLLATAAAPPKKTEKDLERTSNVAPLAFYEGKAPCPVGTVNVNRGGVYIERHVGYEKCGGETYASKRAPPAEIAALPEDDLLVAGPRAAVRDELLSERALLPAWEERGGAGGATRRRREAATEAAGAYAASASVGGRALMPIFPTRSGVHHGLHSAVSSRCEDEYV